MKHTSIREKPLPGIRIALIAAGGILALSICADATRAEGTARYSFRQENEADNEPVIYEKSVGPVPEPLVAMEQTPNSSYLFDVSGNQTSPTSLATRASLSVDVNHLAKPELWTSVTTSAEADASLVDFASVQGPISASSGTIVFNWVVSGEAMLALDTSDSNIVRVLDLSTTATLDSTIPDFMGSLLNESYEYSGTLSNNEVWEQNFGIDSGALTFNVPWQSGMEMPVFFDLMTTAELDISNLDAAGFKAGLDIDLANTAVLSGVAILDDNGGLLPAARLVSRDGFEYPTVPEPSALPLLLGGLIVASHFSFRWPARSSTATVFV